MNDFTDEKLKEFKIAFELFDISNRGLLNISDANSALKCLGYNFSDEELNIVFLEHGTEYKLNANKPELMLTFNSFLSFLNKRCKEVDVEDELMQAFKSFDSDGDGKLDKKEMKYLLLTLGERLDDGEVEEIIKEVDTTGEGVICYKDFVRIMMLK
jgi:Ca2+-binding EF-hand superfamily protein